MKWLSIAGLSVLITINAFIVGGLYLAFDRSISRVAQETIENWYQAESNDILEGNLLTSVSRNQNLLLSSEFLKGVSVFSLEGNKSDVLLNFGKPIDLSKSSTTDQIRSVGFLSKVVTKKVAADSGMFVSFYVFSNTVNDFFWLCTGALVVAVNGAIVLLVLIQRREYVKRANERGEFLAKAALASHDVQSPLMTLNHLAADVRLLPEFRRSLSIVAKNISVILDDLNESRRKSNEWILEISKSDSVEASDMPRAGISKDSVLEIIRLKFGDLSGPVSFSIDDQASDQFFIPLSLVNFSRCIANFIDNSSEAINGEGSIQILVRDNEKGSYLEVIDTGCGIAPANLAKLGTRGFTDRKTTKGTGMGFHYAKKTIESAGGQVSVVSKENVGTTVSIFFPSRKDLIEINILADELLVFVDDDETVLGALKSLVERDVPDSLGRVHCFMEPTTALEFIKNNRDSKVMVICDYDLKAKINGLDLAERLPPGCRFELLTGHAADSVVRQRADSLGIRVISKASFERIALRLA